MVVDGQIEYDNVMIEAPSPPASLLDFQFTAPDRGRMWGELALTIRQAASITGVSPRQIQHWLDRGYLPASTKGSRRVSGNGLDLVSLIHQARLSGVPLRHAVPMAHEFLAHLQVDPLSQMDIGREVIADLEQKLSAAITAIDAVRRVMSELETQL